MWWLSFLENDNAALKPHNGPLATIWECEEQYGMVPSLSPGSSLVKLPA
jgi:hypothetical protein